MDAPRPLTPRIRPYTTYELIGVAVEATPARIIAVRLRVEGTGLESRVEIVDGLEEPLSFETAELLSASAEGTITQLAGSSLSAAITAQAITLVQELLVGNSEDLPLAIGVSDQGLRGELDSGARNYVPLCDAFVLAEATGLSVIDAFPARDLASGGRGEPLDALPLWMLLHDARRARLVLHHKTDWRLTYLPASCEASGAARVMTFRSTLDGASLQDSQEAAKWILAAVQSRVPRHPPLGQIIFTSGDAGPAELRQLLLEQLSDVTQAELADVNVRADMLPAMCAALLAFLHVEQIPAGGTLLTGAAAGRVLGRLTPGTPVHWRRLLKIIADHLPATMSLRSAI